MRQPALSIVLISALLIAACGNSLSGAYADDEGVTHYVFDRSGNVRISVLGAEIDAEYRVDGDKVLVSSAQGTVVLTRREGHLYGPMGLQLKRRAE